MHKYRWGFHLPSLPMVPLKHPRELKGFLPQFYWIPAEFSNVDTVILHFTGEKIEVQEK